MNVSCMLYRYCPLNSKLCLIIYYNRWVVAGVHSGAASAFDVLLLPCLALAALNHRGTAGIAMDSGSALNSVTPPYSGRCVLLIFCAWRLPLWSKVSGFGSKPVTSLCLSRLALSTCKSLTAVSLCLFAGKFFLLLNRNQLHMICIGSDAYRVMCLT